MEPTKPSDYPVFVKDREGNEFICMRSSLRNPKEATEEELAACVDSADAAYDPNN